MQNFMTSKRQVTSSQTHWTETLFVSRAGTNKVQSMRTEDILAKYRRVVRRYKTSRHFDVSWILPRKNAILDSHRKASAINNSL